MNNEERFLEKVKWQAQQTENENFESKEKIWENISLKLDKVENKESIQIWKKFALVASFLLLATLSYLFFLNSNSDNNTNENYVIKENHKEEKDIKVNEPEIKNVIVEKDIFNKIIEKQLNNKNALVLENKKEEVNILPNNEPTNDDENLKEVYTKKEVKASAIFGKKAEEIMIEKGAYNTASSNYSTDFQKTYAMPEKNESLNDNSTNIKKIYLLGGLIAAIQEKDLDFQKKYHIIYHDFGCVVPENLEDFENDNILIFNYLNNNFNEEWKKEVNKNALGLSKWLKEH